MYWLDEKCNYQFLKEFKGVMYVKSFVFDWLNFDSTSFTGGGF